MSQKINIRPTTGVYATYRNLRYEPWTAIAEFVDNSTQSYFDHEKELKALSNFKKLWIAITYEKRPDGKDELVIRDNAYGMEFADFERAIKIDKPPLNTDGRNEFGMGLKTAACWFGTNWTVQSTQLGSEYRYIATVDVKHLSETNEEEINYEIFEAEPNQHGTTITIKNLNKKIIGARTTAKVKTLLESIYREDLRSGEISISYNGNELAFEDAEVYKETLPDGTQKEWKKQVDFIIEHEGKQLPVKGFIAIRQKASLQDAGLALLRRRRVIVGGLEQNYRPKELFGDSNSFTYQRVFGELHMDKWPVTQAKDNFDWHSEGLEEKFIEKLKEEMKELRGKAEKIRVRQKANSADIVKQAVKELKFAGLIENPKITFSQEQTALGHSEPEGTNVVSEDECCDASVIIEGPKSSFISLDRNGIHYNFTLNFDDYTTQWVLIKRDKDMYYITLNMKHPFFKPLINDSKFIAVMTKFVLSMAIAEIESIKMSTDGKIEPSDIRMKMNNLLEESLKIKECE